MSFNKVVFTEEFMKSNPGMSEMKSLFESALSTPQLCPDLLAHKAECPSITESQFGEHSAFTGKNSGT